MQPVTAAGPEHSKPLEKTENLFNQERDPRFSEIYSGISTGRGALGRAARPGPRRLFIPSQLQSAALCSPRSRPGQLWVAAGWQPRAGGTELAWRGWVMLVGQDLSSAAPSLGRG